MLFFQNSPSRSQIQSITKIICSDFQRAAKTSELGRKLFESTIQKCCSFCCMTWRLKTNYETPNVSQCFTLLLAARMAEWRGKAVSSIFKLWLQKKIVSGHLVFCNWFLVASDSTKWTYINQGPHLWNWLGIAKSNLWTCISFTLP